MSISTLEFLKHIRDEAMFLTTATKGVTLDQLKADAVLQRACVRAVEIMGEASKRVPHDFRNQHPQLDWRKMAGMRDRLVHDYFGIDYEIVLDVARSKAPEVLSQIESILEQNPQ